MTREEVKDKLTADEIKAYLRGYKDGRAEMLNHLTTALTGMLDIMSKFEDDKPE